MSNVTLPIAGRDYAVACADGEEDHVASLGQIIDAKIAGMGDTSTQSEARKLLFAALLLADEVHELRGRPIGENLTAEADGDAAAFDTALGSIAERLEKCASLLESARPAS